jgi:hypothetical protein
LDNFETSDVSPHTGGHSEEEEELKHNCTNNNRLEGSSTSSGVGSGARVRFKWTDTEEAFIKATVTIAEIRRTVFLKL